MDNHTLIFCGMVVTLTTTLGMIITQLTRKTYPFFAYWTIGWGLRSLAFLIYTTLVGNPATMVLAGCLDSIGVIANNRGVLVFREQHQANYLGEILGAVLWTSLFAYLTYSHQINDRVMLYSIYHSAYYGWGVAILLTRHPPYAGVGDVLLAGSLGGWAILDLIRGIFSWMYSQPLMDHLPSHPLMPIYATTTMLIVMMMALGQIMMNLQRLEYDYRLAQLQLEAEIIQRKENQLELKSHRNHLEELVKMRTSELSLSESKFRVLVEQSLVGIFIYQDGYLRYANEALCQMLGYASADEFVNRIPIFDLVPSQNRLSMYKRITHEIPGQKDGVTYNIGLLRRNGKIVDVDLLSRGIKYVGKPATIGVAIDVSDRNHATEALRALASRLQSVREEERTRIARDIHDDLGQTMAGLKMKMGWLKKQLATKGLSEHLEDITEMQELTDRVIQSVHDISWALRPGVLDTLGLSAAIEWLCTDFQRRVGIRCHRDLPTQRFDLVADDVTHVFRISQELLNNVARHAHASSVEVKLGLDDNGNLLLEVRDDGIGMGDITPGAQSLGLLGIRERVQQLRGTLDITSTPTLKGTLVRVTVPCRTAQII